MSAGQLIVITVALGLFGGFAIWFGEEEASPLFRYGGAVFLVGALALILTTGPAHFPGPPDRVMAEVPALRPSPSDAPAAGAAKSGTQKTASSTSSTSASGRAPVAASTC